MSLEGNLAGDQGVPSPTWVSTGQTLIEIVMQGKDSNDENYGNPVKLVGEVT